MCCLKLHLELCRNSNLVSFTMINAFWESQAKSKYFMTLFWRRGQFHAACFLCFQNYKLSPSFIKMIQDRWCNSECTDDSGNRRGWDVNARTSNVSSLCELSNSVESDAWTFQENCQVLPKKTFFPLENLIFFNFNAWLANVSSPID